ncbi:hypothetical protein R3P38DRAFT_3168860 [Favolaschia claudopus]|uniref:F-box domain-containing protein n=1 Tax=Favolaschia claudopus TaxID=2862362 RepID=A0AAW0DZ10_9AGAR
MMEHFIPSALAPVFPNELIDVIVRMTVICCPESKGTLNTVSRRVSHTADAAHYRHVAFDTIDELLNFHQLCVKKEHIAESVRTMLIFSIDGNARDDDAIAHTISRLARRCSRIRRLVAYIRVTHQMKPTTAIPCIGDLPLRHLLADFSIASILTVTPPPALLATLTHLDLREVHTLSCRSGLLAEINAIAELASLTHLALSFDPTETPVSFIETESFRRCAGLHLLVLVPLPGDWAIKDLRTSDTRVAVLPAYEWGLEAEGCFLWRQALVCLAAAQPHEDVKRWPPPFFSASCDSPWSADLVPDHAFHV